MNRANESVAFRPYRGTSTAEDYATICSSRLNCLEILSLFNVIRLIIPVSRPCPYDKIWLNVFSKIRAAEHALGFYVYGGNPHQVLALDVVTLGRGYRQVF
jgi:hypothetical protein